MEERRFCKSPLRRPAGSSTPVAYTRSSQIEPISPNTTTELQELRKYVKTHSWNILANHGAREARPCLQTRGEIPWPATVLRIAGIHKGHSFSWINRPCSKYPYNSSSQQGLYYPKLTFAPGPPHVEGALRQTGRSRAAATNNRAPRSGARARW